MSSVQPLVSVICLCYNHAPYVAEALASVWAQTYEAIELIVVDDASTDGSQEVIKQALLAHPKVVFISLEENIGNCSAFNQALAIAQGEWVIDLAADDVLIPERIERQMALAQTLPQDYGVLFSDAWLINAEGQRLKTYYQRDANGKITPKVPQGWVFPDLLRKAFICSPTMLFRNKMLLELGGYDERLSYEDYDLWVRSGKYWRYAFQEELLTQKRVLPHSLGQQFYRKCSNINLYSTLLICQKALQIIDTQEEKDALAVSVRYHLRQSLWMECFDLVAGFKEVLQALGQLKGSDGVWGFLAKMRVPLYRPYRWYVRWLL